MYCKNNIFAVKPSTGQVARWAFVKQTAELRTGWCGRESSEVAFLTETEQRYGQDKGTKKPLCRHQIH